MATSEFSILDKTKASGENGPLYIMQWLAATEKSLQSLPFDEIKSVQSQLEASFTDIVTAAPGYPPHPGRPTRILVSRCLLLLFTRGETRSMYDVLQTLLRTAADPKLMSTQVKIAALYIVGEIMGTLGTQVMSFVGEICTMSLKNAKLSSNSIQLRYHALLTLRKTLHTASRAITDPIMKDLSKQAKSSLTDKALPIQRASADVIREMYAQNRAVGTMSEIESIINTVITKALDSADQVTRSSLAALVAYMLTFTQTEIAAPSAPNPPPAKSNAKKPGENNDSDDETAPPRLPPTGDAAPKTLCSPTEMLMLLSTWVNKPSVSRKARIGIIDFYAALFASLGPSFVEANYAIITKHLLNDVVSPPSIPYRVVNPAISRYDALLVRRLVGTLFRDVIGIRMLSEQGQIGAIKEISSAYLTKWQPVFLTPAQEKIAPTKQILVVALAEVSGLLEQLGNAPPPVQDALSEPLLTLLEHPSHSVRIAAAGCLRSFCLSAPLRLPRSILSLTDLLQRNLSSLSSTPPQQIHILQKRTLGHSHGLASLLSLIRNKPLYVSSSVSHKVLDISISLLKNAGSHPLHNAGLEIEVAWTLIGSLMGIGPGFVRGHLSELMVLWRNALPKVSTAGSSARDASSGGVPQKREDWAFLLRVRESALGAILSFLKWNNTGSTSVGGSTSGGGLVTLDVARRLATLLSNALNFANMFNSAYATREDLSDEFLHNPSTSTTSTSPELPLTLREILLRRRVFQCFSSLGFASLPSPLQSTLLDSTLNIFASSEGGTSSGYGYFGGSGGSAAQAAIASSAGTFTSLWASIDGVAYGVASLAQDGQFLQAGGGDDAASQDTSTWLNRDTVEVDIHRMITKPIIGSDEHDILVLSNVLPSSSSKQSPPPASTGTVDSAIELFSLLLPVQDVSTISRIIAQLIDAVRSPKLEKNVGRKAAVLANSATAIVMALRVAMSGGVSAKTARETLGSANVAGPLADFLKTAILDGDLALRFTGSEALGRLANLGGTSFLSGQTSYLVDQVVNNRDPNGRAGCALTFGAIYTHVGGLAAGPLLRTTVNVLMSLSNDPHPVVHYWALTALGQVINAASLSYSPLVSSTLGMLFKLYTSDTHEPEGGSSLVNATLAGDLPAYQVMCQIIDAVIGVLGPELQESARTRTLTLDLVHEFANEPEDNGIRVEAIKCIQHLLIFGAEFMDVPALVTTFRSNLSTSSSSRRPLKMASINALYALAQKDAFTLSKLGGDQLVEDLFGMLDDDSSIEGVRSLITSWLQQTVVHNPSGWIDLCQRIMSRTNAFGTSGGSGAKGVTGAGGLGADDEGESLSVGMAKDQPAVGQRGGGSGSSRWRTQLFALQCLHTICTTVATSGRKEHLDLHFARQAGVTLEKALLVSRVPDLIKMAFTASAAYVTEIRLEGLIVLRDIIEIFAKSPDPDYTDALLLEQHQAPITSALTPAFSSDSTPEILASAIEACAVFVGSGIVKDVGRMGRILKLLTSALEQCKESGTLTIGDAQELSPNASVMLRVSTLTAWAELEIASPTQEYLRKVLQPYRSTLATLWIASLRDYASIRADTEVLQESASGSMDVAYTGLGREVLLPYYADSWAKILRAVATTMKSGDKYILSAMDGKDDEPDTASLPPRTECTAYYPILLGLVYEALATSPTETSATVPSRYAANTALEALTSLVRPEYSGDALFEPASFRELTALFYRMTLTEPVHTQLGLLEVITSLVSSRDLSQLRAGIPPDAQTLPEDLPLTHCLRVCGYILRNAISGSSGSSPHMAAAERVTLIHRGFTAFTVIGKAFGQSLREDMRGLSVLLYAGLLKEEVSEVDLAGPTLPALKAMLEKEPSTPDNDEKYTKLIHGLLSACLHNIDDMSGRQGLIPTIKVKNNMLAAVVIITTVPPTIKLSRAVLEHCCHLISQRIADGQEGAVTAIHCAKTLVSAAAAGNIALQQCIKVLLPGMITYIANVAGQLQAGGQLEGEEDKLSTQAVEEVLKAFTTLYLSFDETTRPRVLGILMPVFVLLLDRTNSSPLPAVHTIAVAHLLGFATNSSAAFKEVAGKLEASERDILESAIRAAISASGAGSGKADTKEKKQISLRTF